jgi:hypothetical protein
MKIIDLPFEQYYLPGMPVLLLKAVCELSENGDVRRACISDQYDVMQKLFDQGNGVEHIAATLGIAVVDFSAPFRLQPVHIPKPWGQEIWFTGIEARGVSQVISETGTTPLSWVIALDRQRILGSHEQLNLLKILDPLPDEVFGDLYFELHEKKREVYIVTHIDRRAWPNGVGAIRYGFSSEKLEEFAGETVFIVAYRDAVKNYHAVRRELDELLDELRERDGINALAPVSAAQTQCWLEELPRNLRVREEVLRERMESFTALRTLRVGDVLAVPLRTPHALQHGVRTVEFQTPVYERKILSFAQKVLTQDHWDTEEALELAQLTTPEDAPFPVLHDADGVKIEQIVQFDDFTVDRIYLSPSASFVCETKGSYVLLMTVSGRAVCDAKMLESEQAVLVPASAGSVLLQNPSGQPVIILLARPAYQIKN